MDNKTFEIVGAGHIRITESCYCSCGGVTGFSFDVKWNSMEYFSGGVLSIEEARKLAVHILDNIPAEPNSYHLKSKETDTATAPNNFNH